jgi:hypothetical protein
MGVYMDAYKSRSCPKTAIKIFDDLRVLDNLKMRHEIEGKLVGKIG